MSEFTNILQAVERGDPKALEVLGLSERTAKRMWAYARAWLFKEIQSL